VTSQEKVTSQLVCWVSLGFPLHLDGHLVYGDHVIGVGSKVSLLYVCLSVCICEGMYVYTHEWCRIKGVASVCMSVCMYM